MGPHRDQMKFHGNLLMTGIPLLMGHKPVKCPKKFADKSACIIKAAIQTQPSVVLTFTTLLVFAFSTPHCVLTVIPVLIV